MPGLRFGFLRLKRIHRVSSRLQFIFRSGAFGLARLQSLLRFLQPAARIFQFELQACGFLLQLRKPLPRKFSIAGCSLLLA